MFTFVFPHSIRFLLFTVLPLSEPTVTFRSAHDIISFAILVSFDFSFVVILFVAFVVPFDFFS